MLNFSNGNDSNKSVNQSANQGVNQKGANQKANQQSKQTNSIIFQYLQALMSNNRTMLSEINSMKLANQQDSQLIKLINKLWTNDVNPKKENLSSLVVGLSTPNRTIANVLISAYLLAEGNIDEAIDYAMKAKMSLVGIKGPLAEVSNLISFHISISMGEGNHNNLLKVLTPTTEVTKGYFSYLQGLITSGNKSKTASSTSTGTNSEQTKQKHLRDAIASFRRINNLYLLALAQAKLAE